MNLRIVWWCGFDRAPQADRRIPALAGAGEACPVLGRIPGMIASGLGMMALSGAAPLIFAVGSTLQPYFSKYPPRPAPTSVPLFSHQFVRRDGLLGRMRL